MVSCWTNGNGGNGKKHNGKKKRRYKAIYNNTDITVQFHERDYSGETRNFLRYHRVPYGDENGRP